MLDLIFRLKLLLRRKRQPFDPWVRQAFLKRYDIDVGMYSYGCFDRWRIPGPLKVGRYCSFSKTCRVVDANHALDALTTHPCIYEARFGLVDHDTIRSKPLVIEDDVWIGHHAIVLPGCKFIGRGAVIGAGSIVTRDVPAYSIVAGVPAKVMRKRFPDNMIATIEKTRWWDLDLPQLREVFHARPAVLLHPTAENLLHLRNIS